MSVLSASLQQQVEDRLVQDGLIKQDKLDQYKELAKAKATPLFAYLIQNKAITDEDLTRVTAKVSKQPYVNLLSARIDTEVLKLLPQDVAERYMAVPLGEMQQRLVVAMLDAGNVQAVDFLSNKLGRPLKVYTASEAGIRGVLHQYGAKLDSNISKSLTLDETLAEAADNVKDITSIVQDSPISKALNAILTYAANNRASDVHLEPTEKELKIRVRIDGILREIMQMPKSSEPAIVSRIKILSNLKIDEHRIPQDGQFSIKVDNKEVDLRIAIAPIVWGEQVLIW